MVFRRKGTWTMKNGSSRSNHGSGVKAAVFLFFALLGSLTHAATPEGYWQTFGDGGGKAESIVRIEKQGDELVGYIHKLLNPRKKDPRCEKCPDPQKNAPLAGLKFIWGAQHEKENVYSGGQILDPESGSAYRLKMTLDEGGDVLRVRGFIGVSLFGREQTWRRISEDAMKTP